MIERERERETGRQRERMKRGRGRVRRVKEWKREITDSYTVKELHIHGGGCLSTDEHLVPSQICMIIDLVKHEAFICERYSLHRSRCIRAALDRLTPRHTHTLIYNKLSHVQQTHVLMFTKNTLFALTLSTWSALLHTVTKTYNSAQSHTT